MPRDLRALAVQHVAAEPPNLIAAALEAAGVGLDVVRTDRGEPVPVDAERFAAVVVMGGPMSVSDAALVEGARRETGASRRIGLEAFGRFARLALRGALPAGAGPHDSRPPFEPER